MHKDIDISIDNLSKIEGHVDLGIKVRKGEVKEVKLMITETKRFYTQAAREKPAISVPSLMSRICGTCSIAHLMSSTEAVEYALGIKPTPQTITMRRLLMDGLMIRDHAMHLYVFCLPDLLGKDSVLQFEGKEKEMLHEAFHVKDAGTKLSKLIGGQPVHPPLPQVGGFNVFPEKDKIKPLIQELSGIRPYVLKLINTFSKSPFKFERDTEFVCLKTDGYNFLSGKIHTSTGTVIEEHDYWDHLNRVVIPYSQATGFQFQGGEYMVGAIARMNMSRDNLHPDTLRDARKYISKFPSKNVYMNNLAQGIEILNCIDSSMEILETAEFKEEPLVKATKTGQDGVGVVEAPRGTLYYMFQMDDQNKVKYANIVIPTAQNQIKMENDIKEMLPGILKFSKSRIQWEIEKLIRAYDPCMSCASHFLKIKWI